MRLIKLAALAFLPALSAYAAAAAAGETSPQPVLRYDLSSQRLADIFHGAVGGRNFEVAVDHAHAAGGSHYRVEVREVTPAGEYVRFVGNVGELVTPDAAPKNWLGVRFAPDALYVDMCENYDAGCPTSILTTYRLGQEYSTIELHAVSRSRHSGRPANSDWVSVMPLASATPPPPSIRLSQDWETEKLEDVTFRGGIGNRVFKVIAHRLPKRPGSDIAVFVYEDDAFSILPVPDSDAGELTSRSLSPKNWLAVRFAPDAIDIDMCERYDEGCPTSVLSTYKIVGVELRRVSEIRHAGRPENANWVAAAPVPTPTPTPECNTDPIIVTWPPAVVPAALASRYPNGIDVSFDVRLDASGKLISAAPHVARGALYDKVAAFARAASYDAAKKNCKPVASAFHDDFLFLPPSSGDTGSPSVFAGVNFDELLYDPGPCYADEPVQMHNGVHDYFSPALGSDMDTSVDRVFGGRIGALPVAVVPLTCEIPGAFNTQIRLYEVSRGKPKLLSTIGTAYTLAADSPFVEGRWFYVNFASGRLYIDRWDISNRCKRQADWISEIYALRGGKPARISQTRHHRAGVDPVLSEC